MNKAISTGASLILIVVIIVIATFASIAYADRTQTFRTTTFCCTTQIPSTPIISSNTSIASTGETSGGYGSQVPCSAAYSGESDANRSIFQMNESSTLELCVRFYYYNSTNPITVNPLSELQIQNYSVSTEGSAVFISFNNASSEFVVTANASSSTFDLGGPSNSNEGTLVVYQIYAGANSSGIYILNLGWIIAPQILRCAVDFGLIVGKGTPNFSELGLGNCNTMSQSSDNYPYPAGTLFAQVVGYTEG